MAIKLKVLGASAVGLKPGAEDVVRLHTSGGSSVLPPSYTGDTEVTPNEMEQTLATNGLLMPSDVTVHAIDSGYVGSDIPRRDVSDVSVVAADVAIPNGYYDSDVGVSVSAGNVNLPSVIENEAPTITVSSDGTIRSSYDKTVTVTPSVTPGYVASADSGTVRVFGEAEEHMTARHSADLIVSGDTVTAPSGYYPNNASKSVQHGSAATPTGGITANPTITVGNDGLITASVNKSESITPIVNEGYVTSGTAGTITFSGSATHQLTTRDSSDLVVLNDTVTVPSGFYPSEAAAGVSPGDVSVPSTTITATPIISVDANGLITASVNASQSVSPSVSPGWITGGDAGTITASGTATEQLTTQGATTITPTTSTQTAVSAGTYVTGNVDVAAMPNGVRGNGTVSVTTSSTKKRYTMTYPDATSGYYPSSTVANPGYVELTRQTETVAPDETGTTVTPTGSYYWLEQVTVDPIPSNYVGSGVTRNDSSNLTASGATVTAPAGYYANNASKTIAGGSVGLPYATKGTVSGHAVSVTPFVTSTTGYITGQTRTGSAVSVSASELVSGTLPITSNGTGIDVTNYAAVDVSVSGGSPNLQTKTKSYTPTESAQSETVTADVGYDGLDEVSVSVGAISSTYVGSGIAQRTSSDLSASGATVTAPSGYYANAATKTISSGSATPASSISATNATASVSGTNLMVSKTGVNNIPQVTAGYISSGTFGNTDVTLYTPATNLEAGNIKNGVTIFGVTGTYTGGGGSVQYDTKTATASNYPVSLSFTGMKGEPKMFVCRLNASVSSSGSTTYYYIVEIVGANTTVHGNCFRIGSTRQVTSITSGYSWTYTGTTLTITSSAASRSASPGAFYNASYELIYCY